MRINRREQIFLGVGAAFIIILGLYFLLIQPLAESSDKLERTTARLRQELVEMNALAAQYQDLAAGQDRLAEQVRSRGTDFTPFSYLENVARETGLTGRIESMTPVMTTADDRTGLVQFDVRLSGIGLLELVRFLYKLETSDKVFFVENLNIRPRYLTPEQLDVSLRLASPKSS
jgi:general secretion pathway protein M